jgi:DNA repair exonuclease SbcCD ATPase subunit
VLVKPDYSSVSPESKSLRQKTEEIQKELNDVLKQRARRQNELASKIDDLHDHIGDELEKEAADRLGDNQAHLQVLTDRVLKSLQFKEAIQHRLMEKTAAVRRSLQNQL